MAIKDMKRCSTSLIIREVQVKGRIPIKMATIKKTQKINADEVVENLEHSWAVVGDIKYGMIKLLWKTVW